jgi:hypothetical protein
MSLFDLFANLGLGLSEGVCACTYVRMCLVCIYACCRPPSTHTLVLCASMQGNWREMQAVLQAHPHLKTANAGE